MFDEKQHLIDVFENLKDNIKQNKEESLEEIYMDILKTQEKKNKKIKKNIAESKKVVILQSYLSVIIMLKQ